MQNCLEKFTLKAYILLLLRFFCFCFLCYVFACVFFCLLPWWQNHHKICCQPVLLLTDWKKFIKTSKMLQLLLSPFSRQVARYWNQLQACGAVIKQSLGSSVVFFFSCFHNIPLRPRDGSLLTCPYNLIHVQQKKQHLCKSLASLY